MKRLISRILSVALSLTLVTSLMGVPAFAYAADTISDMQATEPTYQEEVLAVEAATEPVVSAIVAEASDDDDSEWTPRKGNYNDSYWDINLTIVDARPYIDRETAQAPTYTVTLSGGGMGTTPLTQALAYDEGTEAGGGAVFVGRFSFPWRGGDSYTIAVSDPYDSYATFTQEIQRPADGRDYDLVIYAGKVSDLATDKAKGSIIYGDFNHDNTVDGRDAGYIIEAIEGKSETVYDLRLDGGATDLVDLAILAQEIGNNQSSSDNHAAIILGFDSANGDAHVNSGTVVDNPDILGSGFIPIAEDNLADLVNNSSIKTIFAVATENNGAISEANPVSIEVNNLQSSLSQDQVVSAGQSTDNRNAGNGDDVMVQGMRITSSSVGKVTDGFITAYYDDENGNEQSIMVPFSQDMTDAAALAAQSVAEAENPLADSSLQAQSLPKDLGAGTLAIQETVKPSSATNSTVEDGVIVINFGKLIAVKKVTLTFTKTEASQSAQSNGAEFNLAAISSVEFLNDMESYVGEAEMDIPTNVDAYSRAAKKFTVEWDRQTNVDGYEISIQALGATEIVYVKQTNNERQSKTIDSFKAGKKGKVQNGVEYTIMVQSVNQNWRSGWGDVKTVMPQATSVPDAPEYVTAVGGVRVINVSWKAVEDAESYTIYYRVRGSNSEWSKLVTPNVKATITGLADNTDYELYVTASNEIGESGRSAMQMARTQSLHAAKLPSYRLINTMDENGNYLANIASATANYTGGSIAANTDLDTARNSVLSLFDNNPDTFLNVTDWDMGTSYNVGRHGVDVTFKSPQSIGFISFAGSTDNVSYSDNAIHYWDQNGVKQRITGCSMVQRDAGNNRKYTLIQFPREVVATRILVGVNRYDGGRGINIAEMRFHGYDSVYEEILGLFEDEAQIQLIRKYANDEDKAARTNPIAETAEERDARLRPVMDELKVRLETPDPISGEDYPMKAVALKELNYAFQLLEDENAGLSDSVAIHADLADAYDNGKNLGIGGLNAWQPLGHVSFSGDEIIVYVNAPGSRGTKSMVDLYIGQHHGESSKAPKRIGTFSNGRTIFTIPASVFSTAITEHGGQMYAVYTGSQPKDRWSVRILGAQKIPTLDLLNVTDPATRTSRVDAYLAELSDHVSNLQATHNENGHKAGNSSFGYKDAECIANATDIMLDKIMYSIPAKQAWAASNRGDTASLLQSLDAADQQMELFYQHKGLMDATNASGGSTGATGTDLSPNRHLNVRYMTMFSGAFMYAAGNHIGIEYGSCSGIGGLVSVDNTTPGETTTTGKYMGWGLAHEIGHNINDGRYSYAEVTNNYFAQMARSINSMTAGNPYGSTRFKYNDVFKRVTSGATAHSGNVFTQLAMYWQLMLGYDNHELYTQYNTKADLNANRFFARLDSYARNPQSFQGAVPLTFTSEQQNIMRLASAAANRDLTAFFKAWGFNPDATTKQFMAQFALETRALQYADETTAHRLEVNGANAARADLSGIPGTTKDNVNITLDGSLVSFDITPAAGLNNADIHGFEITRVSLANGQKKSEIVGFVQEGSNGFTFTDDATHLGNRCVSYEIVAVDKHLNRSAVTATNQVKLNGNGLYSTTGWTVDTNMVTVVVDPAGDEAVPDEEGLECEAETSAAALADASAVLDASRDYTGRSASGDAYITIDMKNIHGVEHLSYTPINVNQAIDGFAVELSSDGHTWNRVISGNLSYADIVDNGSITGKRADIFFPQGSANEDGTVDYINTENARFVKLIATNSANRDLSFKSLRVYGPSGDDIEITSVALGDEQTAIPAIGRLTDQFIYDQDLYDESRGANGVIPKGAIVFTGSFTGNPAYNVVVLYNDRGEIVGGTEMITETITENGRDYIISTEKLKSDQIILAARPDLDQSFSQTSTGRWIYWITDASQLYPGMNVRAELYRVDNAFTNEGQRLVADCAYVPVKDLSQLDAIRFSSETADLC